MDWKYALSLELTDPGFDFTLRRIWLQQYYRCTVLGRETLRWRTGDEQPPSALCIVPPYDLEARYSSKRSTHWWAIRCTSPGPVIQASLI
jgi:hypothetical protein